MSESTEEALASMLRERTGHVLVDSGDCYGRNYQRNQARDLENEEVTTLTFRNDYIEVTHRLYGWLSDRLDLDEEADEAFAGPFLKEVDADNDKDWGELRELFPSWFARWKAIADTNADCSHCDGTGAVETDEGDSDECPECNGTGEFPGDEDTYAAVGLYGDGEPMTINSYNEENLLEQTILFTYFELKGEAGGCGDGYVVLQVHGGSDVRWGYTRPRIFRTSSRYELGIFDYRQATIYCTEDDFALVEHGRRLPLVSRRLLRYERRLSTRDVQASSRGGRRERRMGEGNDPRDG